MNVGEDANIIALAKVIREDELEDSEKDDQKSQETKDGQEQMKF